LATRRGAMTSGKRWRLLTPPSPRPKGASDVTRRRFSTRDLMARLLEHDGCCVACGVKIGPATGLEWDHVIPLAQGGDDELSNLQPLCKADHKAKTKRDASDTARAKRLEAKHIGAAAPSRAVIPGSRRSPWKRRLDGSTVQRNKEN